VREVEEGAALLGRLANKAHPHPSLQSFNGPFSGPIGLGVRQASQPARGRGACAFAHIQTQSRKLAARELGGGALGLQAVLAASPPRLPIPTP